MRIRKAHKVASRAYKDLEPVSELFIPAVVALAEPEGEQRRPSGPTPAEIQAAQAKRIAAYAEAMTETIDLWEFIAPPLLMESEEVASAKLNSVMRARIGRELSQAEMAEALAAYRNAERRLHMSKTRIEKAQAAQQVLAGDAVEAEIARVMAGLSDLQPIPEPGASSEELQAYQADIRKQAEQIVHASSEFREVQALTTDEFTPFTENDI